jgi:signal peptidase II
MKLTQRLLIAGFIVPLTVLLDQWSKGAILAEPRFNALGCLDRSQYCGRIPLDNIPLIDLSMVWNYGMSFGSFQSEGIMRWVLVLVACVIATGFAVWLFRATHWFTAMALSFVVAGAIGNVIDRVQYGAVVDFIDVSRQIPFFPWVFNVADSAVTVGAILLLFDQFILSPRDANGETEITTESK